MFFGGRRAHDAVPAARAAVRRALDLDPSLPEKHALRGYVTALFDLDWSAEERYFETQVTRSPGTREGSAGRQ